MADESLDSRIKERSITRLCSRFAEKTSMQGIPYIYLAKRRVAKVLWTILFVISVIVLILHLYYLCHVFFNWPKITKVTLDFKTLRLPAVTVCNVNQFLNSKADQTTSNIQSILNSTNPHTLQSNANSSSNRRRRRKKRFINYFDDFDYSEYIYYDTYYYGDNDLMGPKDSYSEVLRTFSNLFYKEPRYTRIQIGHDIHTMLLSCTFNGRKCSAANFTIFPTKDYGNCFTIQSPYYVVSDAGPSTGLQMILYMDNKEYLPGITQGYGARLQIHEQGTIPFPEDHGLFVSSNTETQIGLKLVDIERLGNPYGKCETGATMKSKYNLNYTRSVCKTICKQEKIIQTCQCYGMFHEEVALLANLTSGYHPCEGSTDSTCQSNVERTILQDSNQCICLSPCREQVFVETISSRQWPTKDYSITLLLAMCEQHVDLCDYLNGLSETQLSENFLKINVYFEDLNYEILKEESEIENPQFASDVGGAIGLWIGLSMLSIFELVQLCVECCQHGCCKHEKEAEKREKVEIAKPREENRKPNGYELSHHGKWTPEHSNYWEPSSTDSSLYIYRGQNHLNR